MNTNASIQAGEVPDPIAKALRRLIRRVRAVVLVRGLAAVVATAVGSVLAVMAVDAGFTLFSQASRWALTLVAAAATVGVAVWFVVLPLAHTVTLTGIARAIEARHPELQERLSSAVELLTSHDIPEVRGSEALIAALAREATRDAARVRPGAEVPLTRARPFLLAAGGVLIILAALWGLFPTVLPRLLARAVAPFVNLPNVSADMLTIRPGDTVLAEGQRLEVRVTVANPAVKRCGLRREMPDGAEQPQYMTALPPTEAGHPRFTMTLPPAAASFRYRVHAGDALSRFYTVTVVPPPFVKRIDAHYAYPAYTRLPAETRSDVPGDIKAPAGTAVTVTASLNKPVTAAGLRIDGREAETIPVRIATGAGGDTTCEFTVPLKPRMRGRWALALRDAHGFANTSAEHLLEAVPDSPPTVDILDPQEGRLRLNPTDRLPVRYAMTDDYGLEAAEFLVTTDLRKHARVAVPLPGDEAGEGDAPVRSATGRAGLPLADLPLKGAREFTFRLRVADGRPKALRGPGRAFSRTITVEIDRSAPSYAMQQIETEKETLRRGLKKVIEELAHAQRDAKPLRRQVRRDEALDKRLAQRADRLREHLARAEATVGRITPRAADGPFPGLVPKLDDLGREVSAAENQAGQVKLADAAEQRGQAADRADAHIDRARAKAEDLLEELDRMADAASLAQALEDLAARQARLADRRAADTPADGRWQGDQTRVAGEVGDVVHDVPAARQAQLARDAQAAADLADQARQLQADQTDLADQGRQLADLDRTDRALADLAAEQAGRLGDRQADIRRRTEALMGKREQTAQALAESRMARLQREQSQVAREAADLADDVSGAGAASRREPDGPARTAEQAAHDAQAAARQLRRDIAAAADSATGAAEHLDALAKALEASQSSPQGQAGREQEGGQQSGEQQAGGQQAGGQQEGGQQEGGQQEGGQQSGEQQAGGQQEGGQQEGGQQPGGRQATGQQAGGQPAAEQVPRMAGPKGIRTEQAADLAGRQAALAAEMKALAEQSSAAGLAAAQEHVAGRTGDLQQAAQALGQRTAATAPQMSEAAGQASQALGRARQSQGQAQEALSGGEPGSAPGAQESAADSLGQAAETLDRLGQGLAQAAQRMPASPADQAAVGEPLAEGHTAATEAAATQSAAAAAQAAQSLAQAAGQAAAMAQSMGTQPGMGRARRPGRAQGHQANSEYGTGVRRASLTAAKLKALGIELSDWARLPGELRSEILQAADEGGPPEYRDLIKRYFRTIAEKGGAREEPR